MEIPRLPDAPRRCGGYVRSARSILLKGRESVNGVLSAVDVLDDVRRTANSSRRGRMSGIEVDVLRSAIVTTSAALDASMQRLVRDVGSVLVPTPDTPARHSYIAYLKQQLSSGTIGQPMKDALVQIDVASSLVENYLHERTKASFQGSGDLKKRVRQTLGIPNEAVPDTSLKDLDPFFTARNRIVHQMDLVSVDATTMERHRHTRETVVEQCTTDFSVSSQLINAAAKACHRAGI